ncbi:hypothetical protein ASG67_04640 [Sphingomonas sp. Leaf339]|uniref:hypothetical protein n=1 Tax=Sphingomonas sp. Leaf339 TaxID=1736343 RepID=UPI0006F22264|nr:hypothetical protein [Sphingomonas sp. Leaf339]KQU62379.1 hypothetical protein ASG67_04640 [Sphingomonas sp. Leaf339]
MAYDPGAIDATLAAAVGDEPALILELRLAFVTSAEGALSAMETAGEDVDAWRSAAARLRSLAASFGAVRLMAAAADAIDGRPGDLPTLSKLRRAVVRL